MKNRVFISFVCHFLLGIFFSFPVYSFQTIAADEVTKEFHTSIERKSLKDTDKEAGELKYSDLPAVKSTYDKQRIVKSQPLQTAVRIFLLRNEISPSFRAYVENNYVDISYLKELRVTKMLC